MKVLIAGDFSPKFRLAQMVECGKYQEILGEVAPLIQGADYSMVNFESTIVGEEDRPIRKCGPNLSCTPAAAEALKWAGFRMMTMANNHILDYGASSMRRNLDTFDRLGLDHVGAGMNLAEASRTFYKKIDGKTLAVINCCEHEFTIATEQEAGANPLDPIAQSYAIREARKKTDYVLVVVHGGHEHFQLPSPRMQRTYRFFVDCGADAVVNHHQHCFSGMETYRGKPIFYGLGNFCFDYKGAKSKTWCEGFMLELDFDSDHVGWRTIPYQQCPGAHVGVFPMEEREGFDGEFSRLSQIIGSPEELRKAVEKYYDKAGEGYLLPFEPYDNRFLKALRYRRWIPSFFGQKRAVVIKNYINCEAHLDKLRHIISKITPPPIKEINTPMSFFVKAAGRRTSAHGQLPVAVAFAGGRLRVSVAHRPLSGPHHRCGQIRRDRVCLGGDGLLPDAC